MQGPGQRMSEEFGKRPFYAGSIFGERSWDVDYLGQLVAPAMKLIWKPGENVADCPDESTNYSWKSVEDALFNYLPKETKIDKIEHHQYNEYRENQKQVYSAYDYISGVMSLKTRHFVDVGYSVPSGSEFLANKFVGTNRLKYKDGRWGTEERLEIEKLLTEHGQLPEPENHDLEKCSCGFYAYYSSSPNQYINGSRVTGIIEGYGNTLIGTLGFRSEKAKIVALYIPPVKDTGGRITVDRETLTSENVPLLISTYSSQAKIFSDYQRMIMEFPRSKSQDFELDEVA